MRKIICVATLAAVVDAKTPVGRWRQKWESIASTTGGGARDNVAPGNARQTCGDKTMLPRPSGTVVIRVGSGHTTEEEYDADENDV